MSLATTRGVEDTRVVLCIISHVTSDFCAVAKNTKLPV